MKLMNLCLIFLSCILSPGVQAFDVPPSHMARDGLLNDIELWIELQGSEVETTASGWRFFASAAAKDGHMGVLQYLHSLGVDLAVFDDFGNSPLHSAAEGNQLEAIQWLLEVGLDVDIQESVDAKTPLHEAVSRGRYEATQRLLNAGADPLINSLSGTAFEIASNPEGSYSTLSVLHLLMTHWLKHGDGMPPPGISAASWWTFLGAPERVPQRLLQEDFSRSGCNALHWAVISEDKTVLGKILQLAPQAAFSSQCLGRWTPLAMAIRFNSREAILKLLNYWQTVGLEDVRLAVQYASAGVARLLYEELPDHTETYNFWPTGGGEVFNDFDPSDLAFLIEKGVISPQWAITAISERGDELVDFVPMVEKQGVTLTTILEEGLRNNNPHIIDWVLSRRPTLQQVDEDDPSPFIVAAKWGNTQLAQELWHPAAVYGEDNYWQQLEHFAYAGWLEKVLSHTQKRPDLLAYALMRAAAAIDPDPGFVIQLIKEGARAGSEYCDAVFLSMIQAESPDALEILIDSHQTNKECLTKALEEAVEQGNLEYIKSLLAAGANPDGIGYTYSNPVSQAVKGGHLVNLIKLLKAGADPAVIERTDAILELALRSLAEPQNPLSNEEIQGDAITPLTQAVQAGDIAQVSLLVKNGADLTATNSAGETAAHVALRSRQLDIAGLVLSAEVLRVSDRRGRTPFHLIAAYGSTDLAAKALEMNTQAYQTDQYDQYPLDYAVRMNEPVALLLARQAKKAEGNLPVLAAFYKQTGMMHFLSANHQSDIPEKYRDKAEAAFFRVAVAAGDVERYTSLFESVLQPQDTHSGESLLSIAAQYDNLDAFQMIAKSGVGLGEGYMGFKPKLPYVYAVSNGQDELADTLVGSLGWGEKDEYLASVLTLLAESMSEQALVDWLETAGDDALDESLSVIKSLVRNGEQPHLLSALTRAGADLFEEDYSDTSPVDWAWEGLGRDIAWSHRLSLISMLRHAGQSDGSPIWSVLEGEAFDVKSADFEALIARDEKTQLSILEAAIIREDLKLVSELMERGVPVTNESLHIMAAAGRTQVFEVLKPYIYDLNIRDHAGNTPLMTALAAGQTEMANALLSEGARPNVYNDDYRFPLKQAVLMGSEPLVRTLLEHGANPDGFSKGMGQNALATAVLGNHIGIIRLLLAHGASEDPGLGTPPHSVVTLSYKSASPEVMDFLEQTFPRSAKEQQDDLDLAIRFGREVAIRRLLDAGVSL